MVMVLIICSIARIKKITKFCFTVDKEKYYNLKCMGKEPFTFLIFVEVSVKE